MADRENYFVLLGLDPSEDDLIRIEAAIAQKKREWSTLANGSNIGKKREAQHRLKDIKVIEATLKDPVTRAEERKGAFAQAEKSRQDANIELDKYIQAIKVGTTGKYTQEQFKDLERKFAGRLTPSEVQRRLTEHGLTLDAPKARRASRERLDETTASAIRGELKCLNVRSLYEMLELSPRSSLRELCARADDIYRQVQSTGATDAASSARKQLAGQCATHFKTEESRQRYDNTLAFEVMEGFRPLLETMALSGVLTAAQMQHVVKDATAAGALPDIAQEFILDVAEARHWTVLPEARAPVPIRTCGRCMAPVLDGAKACVKCGESLSVECPHCKAQTPTWHAACEKCGFIVANFHVVRASLQGAIQQREAGNLDDALDLIRQGLRLWDGWGPLLEERKHVEALQKQRADTLAVVEQRVRERKLYEARRTLATFSGGAEALRRSVDEGIRRAEEAVARGDAARRAGQANAAVAQYELALAACGDSEEARRALLACPPDAPTDARTQPLAKGFRVAWRAPGGAALAFRVLRRAGGRPTGPTDGVVLGETRETALDDAEVESGVSWYYAVFSLRGGVTSSVAAFAGPCLVAANVERVQVTPGDGCMTLQWAAPPNARRVDVWRQTGREPARAGDGQAVPCTLTGLHDTGLQNGSTYGYLIVAVYDSATPGAPSVTAAGMSVRSSPTAPPRAVTDLQAREVQGVIHLMWTPPAYGQVELRGSEGKPEYVPGAVIARASADRLGALIPVASPGHASWLVGRQGAFHVVPVSVAGDVATLGPGTTVVTVADVTSLRCNVVGRTLVLTWQWPPGVEEVMVRWSNESFPGLADGQGAQVGRRVYEKKQSWDMHAPRVAKHYFTVFAKAPGADLYAGGVRLIEAMGDVVQVTYEVKVKKSLFGRVEAASIELVSDRARSLEGVVVRARTPLPPLQISDGVEVMSLGTVTFQQGRASLPLAPSQLDGRSFIKLFFRDVSKYQEFKLMPGPQDRLRLG